MLEHHEHEVITARKNMELVSTDHILLRMKVGPNNKMQNNIAREDPEEYIVKASGLDYTAYFAARPRYMALDTDPKKGEEIMREKVKPQEAVTIGDKAEQCEGSFWRWRQSPRRDGGARSRRSGATSTRTR